MNAAPRAARRLDAAPATARPGTLVLALALVAGCGDGSEGVTGDDFVDPALPECTRGPLEFFAEVRTGGGSNDEIEWSGVATPSEVPREDEDRFDLLGADGEELMLRTWNLGHALVEDGRDLHLTVHQFGDPYLWPHLELIGREPDAGDGGALLFYLWYAVRRPTSAPAELALDWQPSMCLARGSCGDSVFHSLVVTHTGGTVIVPPGEELGAGAPIVGNAASSELWQHGDCSDTPRRFYAGYVVLAP